MQLGNKIVSDVESSEICNTNVERVTHLFARFEDVALKSIAAPVTGDVTKYL